MNIQRNTNYETTILRIRSYFRTQTAKFPSEPEYNLISTEKSIQTIYIVSPEINI